MIDVPVLKTVIWEVLVLAGIALLLFGPPVTMVALGILATTAAGWGKFTYATSALGILFSWLVGLGYAHEKGHF